MVNAILVARIDDDDNDFIADDDGVNVESMASPDNDNQTSSSWRRYCLKLLSLIFSLSMTLVLVVTHRGVVDSMIDIKVGDISPSIINDDDKRVSSILVYGRIIDKDHATNTFITTLP